MSETIVTMHPDPDKDGVKIDRQKYEMMREAIVAALTEHGALPFMELTSKVRAQLLDEFEGSITWYLVTVKLDLEARGVIEREPGIRPQHLRLLKADQDKTANMVA